VELPPSGEYERQRAVFAAGKEAVAQAVIA
jgi:hypothetical protein